MHALTFIPVQFLISKICDVVPHWIWSLKQWLRALLLAVQWGPHRHRCRRRCVSLLLALFCANRILSAAVLFFLCFALLALARRRRLQAHYRSYLTQQQPQPAYQQPQYGGGAYGPQQEGYGAPNSPGYNQYPAVRCFTISFANYLLLISCALFRAGQPAGPPPGYNEPQPQVPGNVYRGSKV